MLNLHEMEKLYDAGLSPYEIAEKLATYPNKVRRALKKMGKILRDKGEAQSKAFESGRKKHPTKGQKRPDDVKNRISSKVVDHWENMSDTDYEAYVDGAKDRWKKISKKKKLEMQKKAGEGIRKAAKEGSAPENCLAELIKEAGFSVRQHCNFLKNQDLECDIYLPEISTVIELDGISHSQAIWSEERLKKAQRADFEKNGLVLRNGLCIIRVKYSAKRLTLNVKNQFKEKVILLLQSFKTKFPEENHRYIEIEVK